jgi:hypothetical protein
VLLEIAQEPPGRLLGADALAQLAGAQIERLDLDAIFLLEGIDDRLVIGGAERRVVDDDLALLLGRGDDLVPVSVLRGGRSRGPRSNRQHGHGEHGGEAGKAHLVSLGVPCAIPRRRTATKNRSRG